MDETPEVVFLTQISTGAVRIEFGVRVRQGEQRVLLNDEELREVQHITKRYLDELSPHLTKALHRYSEELERIRVVGP